MSTVDEKVVEGSGSMSNPTSKTTEETKEKTCEKMKHATRPSPKLSQKEILYQEGGETLSLPPTQPHSETSNTS